jgi:acyl phosphate:glycerol-3-phosphate acyltransferase
MDILILILVLIGSYLVGSISFARMVTHLFAPQMDVTEFQIPVGEGQESYNVLSIGANSVSSVLGAKAGMLTSALDMLKCILPVLALKLIFSNQPYYLFASVACMAGHIWPIYYHFHGGSGWSPAFGTLLVVDWLGALVTPVAGIVLGILVRDIKVMFLAWIWLVIPWLWLRTGDPWQIGYAVAINLLFILAMIPELMMMNRYRKEGRLLEYGVSSITSNPMGRSFVKIAKWFKIEIQ